ncbi:hypothetical protein KUCAC02_019144 [Chaenocephalus aceratus]|uniref:Uncharacterized protein n=1 Tax=Chaenocephalus aceratus TaxID=36190 RepID=A0ACB9WBY9_CHAAC|nr:hypothetical protein KUCAC02_019144 [Chaenocephalus aceratus]
MENEDDELRGGERAGDSYRREGPSSTRGAKANTQRGPDGIGEARGGEDEENVEQEAANVSDISQGTEAASDISQGPKH